MNPTPLKSSEAHVRAIYESIDESNADTSLMDNSFNTSAHTPEKLRSRTHNVCGEPRQQPVPTPPSILGSRPNAVPNEKFTRVEGAVRCQVNTASIANISHLKDTSALRGFVLIPDAIDFGVLNEGKLLMDT